MSLERGEGARTPLRPSDDTARPPTQDRPAGLGARRGAGIEERDRTLAPFDKREGDIEQGAIGQLLLRGSERLDGSLQHVDRL